MAGAPAPKLSSFPGPVAQVGGGFASALKPNAKAGNNEAAAAVDQLAEAGDAFGAREILARLNYRLPAVPMAGTPLLRSAFYFKEALRVALSPTGEALAPPRGVDVVRRGPEARRVQGLLRGVPHAPVRAPHRRAGGAGQARRVPPVRGIQRGRPGPRGAGGHHQQRRSGRTPPRGVGPRGRNAGRASPREAARRQGGGVRGPRMRPHGAAVRHAPVTGVPVLRVPAGLCRRRGGRERRGGRQDRAVHGQAATAAVADHARVGGVRACAGQHVRRVAGRGPTQADSADGVLRGEARRHALLLLAARRAGLRVGVAVLTAGGYTAATKSQP
jgi:hypothetical protein